MAEGIKVNIKARCSPGGTYEDSNKCEGIDKNELVSFKVELTMDKVTKAQCLEIKKTLAENTPNFKIYGMSQDGVQLKLDVICDCPCKDSKSDFSNIKVPAALVDTFGAETFSCQHGLYHCGVCVCDEGYSGLMCQCESDKVLTDQCTNPDNPEVICSGEGFCNCDGKCMCNRYGNREITGTYCQHDTGFCPKGENGLPCSGHGKCNVDDYTCSCDAGWTGDACGCSTS